MAVRDFQSQIGTLVNQSLVEGKTQGTANPQLEARALYNSIALNLLLRPKSVLYLAQLAKNKLIAVSQQELDAIDALEQTVADLGNTSYAITDTSELQKARISLIQLQQLDKISTDSGAYQRFDKSVSTFMNTQLAKNLQQPGQAQMARPSNEAAQDLPNDYQTLLALHADFIDRVYALAVGVNNFESAPLSTILGIGAVQRSRLDLEQLLDQLQQDNSAALARDTAVRLISARAAIKSMAQTPAVDGPVVDSVTSKPVGYALTGVSDSGPVVVTGSAAPVTLGASAQVSVQVGATTLGPVNFPQASVDLNNRACVVGAAVSWPVTIPASSFLYVTVGTTTYNVPLTAGSRTLAQVVADIVAVVGAGTAMEFCKAGSGRLLIVAGSSPVTIANSYTSPGTFTLVPPVTGVRVYTVNPVNHPTSTETSAHALLGFSVGMTGRSGSTPLQLLVDAFNLQFGSLATAALAASGFVLTSVSSTLGTALIIAADSALGISGTWKNTSPNFRLVGTVAGTGAVDPVDPRPLMDVGDAVSTPTGTSTISSLSDVRVVLNDALPTFSGNITVTSALDVPYTAVAAAISTFLPLWAVSKFASSLAALDTAVARLTGSPTPALRNQVSDLLDELRGLVSNLNVSLSDPSTALPANCATGELEIINGVIASLEERKFDKALDLFLRCRVLDMFELDQETSSYGGSLTRSMSNIATADLKFPNRSQDETGQLLGVRQNESVSR